MEMLCNICVLVGKKQVRKLSRHYGRTYGIKLKLREGRRDKSIEIASAKKKEFYKEIIHWLPNVGFVDTEMVFVRREIVFVSRPRDVQ